MAAEGVKNEPRPSDAPSVPSTSASTPRAGSRTTGSIACSSRSAPSARTRPSRTRRPSLLGAARDLLDDVAVGVCVPRAALGRSGALAGPAEGGQIVLRFAPTRASHPTEPDPARLFPELAFERAFPIAAETRRDPARRLGRRAAPRRRRAAPRSWLERLALMLAALLDNHRALERRVRRPQAPR